MVPTAATLKSSLIPISINVWLNNFACSKFSSPTEPLESNTKITSYSSQLEYPKNVKERQSCVGERDGNTVG